MQASGHVEVTLAADSKADIISAPGLTTVLGGSDQTDKEALRQTVEMSKLRQFESHETALLK